MEYKKIENLIYKQNMIKEESFNSKKEYLNKLDEMLIENLKKCIDKNISLDINEKELCKVYKIYLKLKREGYIIEDDFIFKIINLSSKKINYLSIINNIDVWFRRKV